MSKQNNPLGNQLVAHELAEQNLRHLAAVIQSSDDAIISKNLSGIIQSWNNGAERIFGYTAHEAIGQSVLMLIPADHQNEEPEIIKRIRAGARIEHYETVRKRKDGRLINVSLTVSPIKDDDGTVIGASKIARDVSERVRADEKLRHMAAVIESSGDAIISKTLGSIITTWNGSAERIFGYAGEEVIGKSIAILIPPDHLNEEPAIIERIKRGERVEHYETIRQRKDGTLVNISLTISPIRDAAGNVIGASKIARDITEQKRLEEELRLQREWFGVTLASIGDAVITSDTKTRLTYLNPVAEKLTGWKLADAIGRPLETVFDIIHEQTRAKAENPIEKALREGRIVELANHTALISKDGQETAIEDSAAPIKDSTGKIIGAVMVFHDVTEQRRAQEALGLNERFNRAIVESSRDCLKTLTLDGDFLWMSGAAQKILCVKDVKELLGKSWINLWNDEGRLQAQAAVTAAARGDVGEFVGFMQVGGKDKWWNVVVTPITNAEGRPEKLLAVSRDVTERRQTDEALRRSEEELRAIADNINQLAWTCDALGDVTWYNKRWLDYTGMTFAEMKDWGWMKVQHPDHVDRVVASVTRSREGGQEWEDTFPLRGKDGVYRWFLSRAIPIRDAQGNIIRWFGTNTDITGQREAEQKLHEAKQVAENASRAKDHFIAALSHELRTPLSPVLSLLSNLAEDSTLPKTTAADLETIRRNVELEVRLIDDLLDLTRITRNKLDLHYVRTPIGQIIEDAINTSSSDMKARRISLVREIPNAGQMVFTDNARITQIIWNLLKNSIKFTPEDGTITVRSCFNSDGDANTVTIEVQDTGIGINPANINRVFDAFEQGDHAVTRQFGGLGLGLAISRAIAEAHHGTLTAISEGQGHGSTFSLTLPVYEKSPKFVSEGRDIPAGTAKTSGMARPALRILLVEDHVDTANSLSMLLRRRGFTVTVANNVAKGLERVAAEPFDLLISDLGLPDASGYELMEQVRLLQPMPGIALSGYGMEDDIKKCHDAGFCEHLVKPVRIMHLEEAIGRIFA